MKEKRWLRILLPLLVCALLVSCGTPGLPEGSSAPAESSETIPAPEDPNVRIARAYLEELLAQDWTNEESYIHWLTPERAEAIRDCVKQLKTPILTEEDAQRIAERAVLTVIAALEQSRVLEVPACGVLAEILWSPATPSYSCEACYQALVGYTLYLFTPPYYVFRESEMWGSGAAGSSDPMLYLSLAGDYTSRQEALAMLRGGGNGVALPLSGFGDEEHPLDCYRCGVPILFCGSGEVMMLEMLEVAQRENVTLPESVLASRAEKYVWEWINCIADGENIGVYDFHGFPDGDYLSTYQLFSAETVQEIREMVELLPAPLLTEEIVWELEDSAFEYVNLAPLLLLPGFDGAEDILLPSGVESMGDFLMPNTESALAEMAHGAVAYLIDLFTPSAYRVPDLFGIKGVYYALNEETESYVLVTEAYKSGEGGLELLCVETPMEEQTE